MVKKRYCRAAVSGDDIQYCIIKPTKRGSLNKSNENILIFLIKKKFSVRPFQFWNYGIHKIYEGLRPKIV